MTTAVRNFSEAIQLHDGEPALLRAIRPDDRDRLATAFLALDPESVYLRYFSFKREMSPDDLDRACSPDFRDLVVLVVTIGTGADEAIIGCGHYVAYAATDGSRIAEVAFVVEDSFHGHGIASRLLAQLADIARADGVTHFEADVLGRNSPMLQVFAHSGLPMLKTREEDGIVSLSLALLPTSSAASPAGASR